MSILSCVTLSLEISIPLHVCGASISLELVLREASCSLSKSSRALLEKSDELQYSDEEAELLPAVLVHVWLCLARPPDLPRHRRSLRVRKQWLIHQHGV